MFAQRTLYKTYRNVNNMIGTIQNSPTQINNKFLISSILYILYINGLSTLNDKYFITLYTLVVI